VAKWKEVPLITAPEEWDSMVEAARFALDRLTKKGDELADLMEETPSPEAIVKAALERAASEIVAMRGPTDVPRTEKAAVFDEACDRCLWILMDLASYPAEVAAIIEKAGEDRG